MADTIAYYSQWRTWPKWLVPYRLWRFSHKFEHPQSTLYYFSFPLILSVTHMITSCSFLHDFYCLMYVTSSAWRYWNKMKPTNPNAHTYVNGTVSKHMVMQWRTIPFCNRLFEQSCTCFPCYQSAVWSGKCRVWSVECEVRSVECKVRSGECRMCKV